MNKKNDTGQLKDLLIENGLLLLNTVGFENFSIRKVAIMSGVSHAAPYKHFKNKDEMITAISMSVVEYYIKTLKETIAEYVDPKIRLVELGKKNVQFMVENPEYMKFLLYSPIKQNVMIEDNRFLYNKKSAFALFKDTASAYLDSIGADPTVYVTNILTMLSIVEGITILITEQSLSLDNDDYLNIVSTMLNNHLNMLSQHQQIVHKKTKQ